MTSIVRASLAALVAAGVSLAAIMGVGAETAGVPGAPPGPDGQKWAQRWMDERAAMLEARLAGLKAGLRLTPEQEKLWPPFEAAIRDFAQTRTAHMQRMMERADKAEGRGDAGPPPSPIDRLDMMAVRLSDVAAELKTIADAGKPLYASLDDQQKRIFGLLSQEMITMGRGPHGMGPMEHHRDWSDEGEGDDE
jgi:hypothetical protein